MDGKGVAKVRAIRCLDLGGKRILSLLGNAINKVVRSKGRLHVQPNPLLDTVHMRPGSEISKHYINRPLCGFFMGKNPP
jgi:hypothetical protein